MKKYMKIAGIVFLALLLLLFLPMVNFLAQQLFMLSLMIVQIAIAVVMMRVSFLVILLILGKKKFPKNLFLKLKSQIKQTKVLKKRTLEKVL